MSRQTISKFLAVPLGLLGGQLLGWHLVALGASSSADLEEQDANLWANDDVRPLPSSAELRKKATTSSTGDKKSGSASAENKPQAEEPPREPSPFMLELGTPTFDDKVFADLPQVSTFVKFYAPWCGHCKALRPAWDKLAEVWESDKSVQIADVDCDKHFDLCARFRVHGYPTLRYFTNKTGTKGEEYKYQRDEFMLKKWVSTQLAKPCGVKAQKGCSPKELGFIEKMMLNGGKATAGRSDSAGAKGGAKALQKKWQKALSDAIAVFDDEKASITQIAWAAKRQAILEDLLGIKKEEGVAKTTLTDFTTKGPPGSASDKKKKQKTEKAKPTTTTKSPVARREDEVEDHDVDEDEEL